MQHDASNAHNRQSTQPNRATSSLASISEEASTSGIASSGDTSCAASTGFSKLSPSSQLKSCSKDFDQMYEVIKHLDIQIAGSETVRLIIQISFLSFLFY